MSKPFTWDSNCLTRTVIDVPIPTKTGPVTVRFSEFSRPDLLAFFGEGAKLDLYVEVPNPAYDPELGEMPENPEIMLRPRPVTEVEGERYELVCKYLALASDKPVEWWRESTDITIGGFGYLVDLLYQLNHIGEILAAQGNYLALPAHLRNEEAPLGS